MLLNILFATLAAATLATQARGYPAQANETQYEYVVVGSGAGGGSLA